MLKKNSDLIAGMENSDWIAAMKHSDWIAALHGVCAKTAIGSLRLCVCENSDWIAMLLCVQSGLHVHRVLHAAI